MNPIKLGKLEVATRLPSYSARAALDGAVQDRTRETTAAVCAAAVGLYWADTATRIPVEYTPSAGGIVAYGARVLDFLVDSQGIDAQAVIDAGVECINRNTKSLYSRGEVDDAVRPTSPPTEGAGTE